MLFNIVRALLLILEVLTCIALIAAILLQKSKSQGMGLAFGGGMGESLFGAQIGNVMTKITIVLATVFLVNTAVLAWMGTGKSTGSSVVDGMTVEAPAAPAPVQQPVPVSQPQPVVPSPSAPVDLPPMPVEPTVPPPAAE